MILSGRGELGSEEGGGEGGGEEGEMEEEEGMEEGLLARERAWVASGGREVRWREAVRGRGREGVEVDVGGGISEVIFGGGEGGWLLGGEGGLRIGLAAEGKFHGWYPVVVFERLMRTTFESHN